MHCDSENPDKTAARSDDPGVVIGGLKIPLSVICVIWVGLIVAGQFLSIQFQTRPSPAMDVPARWPAFIELSREIDQPVLVMFLHPHCPCSRASLTELASVLQPFPSRVKVHVIFFDSPNFKQRPQQSETWKQAEQIPGVTVGCDRGGHLSGQFCAKSSGCLVMYDECGRLLFSGGITASRGHVGKNAGTSAITALLNHDDSSCRFNSVYGCSISVDTNDREESVQ